MSRLPVPWVVWNAHQAPLPNFSGKRVVLLEQDVFTPGAQPPPVLQGPQHTFILPTHFPNMLGKMLEPVAPPNMVPALLVEEQADLATYHLRDLVKIPASYRALVITPREPIALGLLGVMPKDWSVGYTPLWARINLVIVRGPEGEDVWPLELSWVRALRDECAFLAPHVAFAFLGWGRYLPERRRDKIRHMLDGREHFAVPWAQGDEDYLGPRCTVCSAPATCRSRRGRGQDVTSKSCDDCCDHKGRCVALPEAAAARDAQGQQ